MKKSLSAVVLAVVVTLLMAGNSHAINSVPQFKKNPKIFNKFSQFKKKGNNRNLRSKRRTTIPRVSKNQISSSRTQYQGRPSPSRIRGSRNTYITTQDGVRGGDPIDPFGQTVPPSTSANNDSSNQTVALAEPNLVTAPTVSIVTPAREVCHWEWKVNAIIKNVYLAYLKIGKVTHESLEAKGIMRRVCVWVK